MSTLVLGDEPDRLELKLTRGDGFFQELELSEDDAPVERRRTRSLINSRSMASSVGSSTRRTSAGLFSMPPLTMTLNDGDVVTLLARSSYSFAPANVDAAGSFVAVEPAAA